MNVGALLLAFTVVLAGCAPKRVATGPDFRSFGRAVRETGENLPLLAAERRLTLSQTMVLLEQSLQESARTHRVPIPLEIKGLFAYIQEVADRIDRGNIGRGEAEYLVTKRAKELQKEEEQIIVRQMQAEQINEARQPIENYMNWQIVWRILRLERVVIEVQKSYLDRMKRR